MKPALRMAFILLTAAVLQRGLFSQLRVGGVAADILLLVAVAAGLTGGPDRGAVAGFFAGLTLDLLLQTPLGLSALVYCLAGFLAGRLRGTVVRANRLLPALLTGAVSAGAVFAYAVVAEMVGRTNVFNQRLILISAVVAVVNTVLSPVAQRTMRWVWSDDTHIRPALR